MSIVTSGDFTIIDVNDSLNMRLTQESIVIATDAEGLGGDYVAAKTTAQVFQGKDDMTAGWTFTAVASVGLTGTLNGATFTVADATEDGTYVDITGCKAGFPNLTARFTITKVRKGATGSAMALSASRLGFTFTDGAALPADQSIAVTLIRNGAKGKVSWFADNGKPVFTDEGMAHPFNFGSMTMIGQGDTAYVSLADFGAAVQLNLTAVLGDNTLVQTLVRLDFSTAAAGATRNVFRGEWETTKAYSVGDTVLTTEGGWACIQAHVSAVDNKPPAGAYWAVANVKGDEGVRGSIQTAYSIAGSSWSDASAVAAILAATGGSPIRGDVVTLFNASGFSQTRVYKADGTWFQLAAFFGGDVLVDGTVYADKIASGAVTADKVAAGSIIASKIAVIDLENLWSDGMWAGKDTSLLVFAGGGVSYSWSNFAETGDTSLVLTKTVLTQEINVSLHTDRAVPVKADEYFYAECAASASVAITSGFYYRILWLNAAKVEIAAVDVANNIGLGVGFSTTPRQIQAPSGAKFAIWKIHSTASNSTAASIYIDRVVMRRAKGSELTVDGTITGVKIAANAITAAKIAAGTITSKEIAAGAITAKKLAVTDWTNIVPNGTFEDVKDVADYWEGAAGGGNRAYLHKTENASYCETGEYSLLLQKSTTDPTLPTSIGQLIRFPVIEGEPLYCETVIKTNQTATSGGAYIRFFFYKEDGSPATLPYIDIMSDVPITPAWVKYTKEITVPAGAVRSRIAIYSTSTSSSNLFIDRIIARRMNAGELIVNGTITGTKIAANTITAAEMTAGAINTRELAANAVTITNLAIADFENLCPDPQFLRLQDFTGDVGRASAYTSSWASYKTDRVMAMEAGTADTNNGYRLFAPANIGILQGSFYAECYINLDGTVGNTAAYIRIYIYNTAADGTRTYIRSVGSNLKTTAGISLVSCQVDLTDPAENTLIYCYQVRSTNGAPTTAVARFNAPSMRRKNGGELVVDGALKARHMATELIISNVAQLGVAVVSTAAIGDAAITTAKIGDLQVDTLKIKDNAVSTIVRAFKNTSVSITKSTTESTGGSTGLAIELVIARTAGLVTRVDWSCIINPGTTDDTKFSQVRLAVSRDKGGVLTDMVDTYLASNNKRDTSVGISFVDSDTSGGTVNYYVSWKSTYHPNNVNCSLTKQILEASQFKK